MNKHFISAVLGAVLIGVFMYTATNKLATFHDYISIMGRQPLPKWSKPILVWAIPISELFASLLLFIPKRRRAGFAISTFLMSAFTLYIILGLSKAFSYVPCVCGGIFRNITWNTHLYINFALLAISIAGLFLTDTKIVNNTADKVVGAAITK